MAAADDALGMLAGFAAMKSGGGGAPAGSDAGGGPAEIHEEPELVADGQNHWDSHRIEPKTYGKC